MSNPSTPEIHRPSNAARVLAVAGASVAGLLATALLAAGGVALWGDAQKDAEGYISTSSEPFTTDTYAIATENLDVNTDAPGWVVGRDSYGTLRLKAKSQDGRPVFVGVAPTSDVARYLDGSAHATVTDLDYSPFHADYVRHGGVWQPAPPAEQGIWTASAHGAGTQQLDWKVRDGNWSVVVMNADGSAGVHTEVRAGAKISFLDDIGWGAIGGGLLLLFATGGLLYLGLRGPGTRPPAAPAPATPVAAV